MARQTITHAEWLGDKALQTLLAALSSEGEEARVVGGAVRNTLLGEAVSDIDIATTATPRQTVRRARKAGFRTAPTGIEHGTVTVIGENRAYEVTTLRSDINTDGRHAQVTFGRDWQRDAERRDFTINALYATASGEVIDLVGGLGDLEKRNLRFIGDAETRIREDYLRILRFFRFFAWYGAGRPEAGGLKACARLKDGMERLSAERVWAEMKKLLAAPDPSRALLWMRQTGVLTKILPESEKWGIDAVPALIEAEQHFGWKPDALLRLASIIPPQKDRVESIAKRLKFSRAEKAALLVWADTALPGAGAEDACFRKFLYLAERTAVLRSLKLALSNARRNAPGDEAALRDAAGYTRLLGLADEWEKPRFPVSGEDLISLGVSPGKKLGAQLSALEDEWIASDFSLPRDALLQRAADNERG